LPSPKSELENGPQLQIDFKKLAKVVAINEDVIPVIVQNSVTLEVLTLAYVNQRALDQSIHHQKAVFWSTSRNELWVKGASSGDFLKLEGIRVNCEQNSLLFLVTPVQSGVCHTTNSAGKTRDTCYYRDLTEGQLTHRDP